MMEVVLTDEFYIGKDEMYCGWHKCPNCGGSSIAYSFKYCPDCGAKVTHESKVK